jgi:hypothetical protein
MDFRDAWRHLKKAGWSSAPGTGVDDRFYYIKPGCKRKTGTEGTDYFLGEDALVEAINGDAQLRSLHGLRDIVNVRQKTATAIPAVQGESK